MPDMFKDRHSLIGWINFGLAVTMCIYGFYAFIDIFSKGNKAVFINVAFPIYYMLFGFIMFMSFCSWKFITEQFLFLKTTTGRGFFNVL